MKLPEFTSYTKAGNNNTLVFTVGVVDVYFSYRTPVAFRSPEAGLVVRENAWGITTGRHLNVIDGGSKAARIGEAEFLTLLSAAVGD